MYFEETVGLLPEPSKNGSVVRKASSSLDRYFDDLYAEKADYFNNLARASKTTLINGYKGIVYTCANINAAAVACSKPKLYVKTAQSDQSTRLKTKSVDLKTSNKIREKYTIREEVLIEEVVEHPILSLLHDVDKSMPFINEMLLWEYTQLYQEICGEAYWWVQSGPFGIPSKIKLLPSQYVHPVKNVGSKKEIDYYRYQHDQIDKQLPVNEIIQFVCPGVQNPYVIGLSPEEASYEAATLISKLKSMMTGVFSKEGRPDMIITPKEIMGTDEATSYERRMNLKFGTGRSGGIHVFEEPIDVKVLTTPPREMARLELEKSEKDEVCNAFLVPPALLKSEVNKETLDASLELHALMATKPRLMRNNAVLNARLVPLYDSTGRLFLESDDPVPENKEVKLQENVQLKMNGCKTANEVRKEYNLPPHPDGDKLIEMSTAGAGQQERNNSRAAGTAEK